MSCNILFKTFHIYDNIINIYIGKGNNAVQFSVCGLLQILEHVINVTKINMEGFIIPKTNSFRNLTS